jgi:hypothetical protein
LTECEDTDVADYGVFFMELLYYLVYLGDEISEFLEVRFILFGFGN